MVTEALNSCHRDTYPLKVILPLCQCMLLGSICEYNVKFLFPCVTSKQGSPSD